jgi:hypothetical protein|tara:strand:+ start:12441 stop:13121 length:681 start_codon:yes stop_codon:yes gene_type:complete
VEKLADDIWVHEDEIMVGGSKLGLRMTVVRLAEDKLWVHSPTTISDTLIEEVNNLGEVACIVGPNNAHNLFLMEWRSAYPQAQLYVSKGIPKKLKLTDGFTPLQADFNNIWEEDLAWAYLPGFSVFDESVFLHKKSKSLIVTDYIQNYEGIEPTFIQKFILGPIGFKGICIAPPLKLGFLHKDKAGYGEALTRVEQWQFERIIVTHGDIIDDDAMATFTRLSSRFT